MPSARHLITFRPRDTLDRVFAVGVVIKGLDGLLELVAGLLLLITSSTQIVELADALGTALAWVGVPSSVGSWAITAAEHTTTTGLGFGAAYLLVHGVVKVVLVAALLRDQLWAYPWMIVVLAGFVAVQLYDLVRSPGAGLIVLTVIDLAVIVLTWREYRRHRRSGTAAPSSDGDEAMSRDDARMALTDVGR